jgi:hypothetical protein
MRVSGAHRFRDSHGCVSRFSDAWGMSGARPISRGPRARNSEPATRLRLPTAASVRDAELLEQFGPRVVSRQVELVAEQSGSMTTVLPPEVTFENEGGEPDRWSAGTRAGRAPHSDGSRSCRTRKFPCYRASSE